MFAATDPGERLAYACRGDLHNALVWADRDPDLTMLGIDAFGVAAADGVPLNAAHEIALANCTVGTPVSLMHVQHALAIAPTNSYVMSQGIFSSLPVSPNVALALAKRNPSDFVALTVARWATGRAGDDVASNVYLVRAHFRHLTAVNPQAAQNEMGVALYAFLNKDDADIVRRHGTKQREMAAYRAASRDMVASAPPHLDPEILAFAERGTLPQVPPRRSMEQLRAIWAQARER